MTLHIEVLRKRSVCYETIGNVVSEALFSQPSSLSTSDILTKPKSNMGQKHDCHCVLLVIWSNLFAFLYHTVQVWSSQFCLLASCRSWDFLCLRLEFGNKVEII